MPLGISNSPAWIGSCEPNSRAMTRKVLALPRIAPAFSSWRATEREARAFLDDDGVRPGFGPGPAPQQIRCATSAARTSSAGAEQQQALRLTPPS